MPAAERCSITVSHLVRLASRQMVIVAVRCRAHLGRGCFGLYNTASPDAVDSEDCCLLCFFVGGGAELVCHGKVHEHSFISRVVNASPWYEENQRKELENECTSKEL